MSRYREMIISKNTNGIASVYVICIMSVCLLIIAKELYANKLSFKNLAFERAYLKESITNYNNILNSLQELKVSDDIEKLILGTKKYEYINWGLKNRVLIKSKTDLCATANIEPYFNWTEAKKIENSYCEKECRFNTYYINQTTRFLSSIETMDLHISSTKHSPTYVIVEGGMKSGALNIKNGAKVFLISQKSVEIDNIEVSQDSYLHIHSSSGGVHVKNIIANNNIYIEALEGISLNSDNIGINFYGIKNSDLINAKRKLWPKASLESFFHCGGIT